MLIHIWCRSTRCINNLKFVDLSGLRLVFGFSSQPATPPLSRPCARKDWVGFCRLACLASVIRYTGQSHTQYLVPDAPPLSSRSSCRGAFRAVPSSPGRARHRAWARSTRRRPLHTMPLLLLPHTLSLVQTPTPTGAARPRRAPGREEEAVAGGGVDGDGSGATDSTSSNVHSGRGQGQDRTESSSEPANLRLYRGHTALVTVVSHRECDTQSPRSKTYIPPHPPLAVCTRDTCTHCCACHITHRSKKG